MEAERVMAIRASGLLRASKVVAKNGSLFDRVLSEVSSLSGHTFTKNERDQVLREVGVLARIPEYGKRKCFDGVVVVKLNQRAILDAILLAGILPCLPRPLCVF